jgi:cytosine/adenosine deaminase-related metal-dependent hydrolase
MAQHLHIRRGAAVRRSGHAERLAKLFFDELLRQGTTTAVAYCSVHKGSADAYFAEAARRNLLMVGGKVMMDRNAPDALTDTAQSGYDDTKAVIARHGMARRAIMWRSHRASPSPRRRSSSKPQARWRANIPIF